MFSIVSTFPGSNGIPVWKIHSSSREYGFLRRLTTAFHVEGWPWTGGESSHGKEPEHIIQLNNVHNKQNYMT